ncbi:MULTISPECIES: hypothetical protein [unclassified Saccharibacter]|uniref:hypothetical protein n=1 Tax=unclassified Saccharibacter TaxID=2648722 RepID=UPI001321BD4E|nr:MULTISPECIES: hypothetical protein [unclassified Saccharibacter]MXV35787.1 hypothetical protein [Saccharibacter sp. EH611]MXV57908.1 hypothetical protein [Saccharibacter sp. EH70]MXV66303.1 hypothetical protein [Saccharibacter sp. EH60]
MIHLHAVAQPQQGAVLVPITPDEKALELGRMLLGLHRKSNDLWAQEKPLTAIKSYFERLELFTDENAELSEFFGLMAADLDEDGIPGLQSFLEDQREAGSAADRYWQSKDTSRNLNQDDRVMG